MGGRTDKQFDQTARKTVRSGPRDGRTDMTHRRADHKTSPVRSGPDGRTDRQTVQTNCTSAVESILQQQITRCELLFNHHADSNGLIWSSPDQSGPDERTDGSDSDSQIGRVGVVLKLLLTDAGSERYVQRKHKQAGHMSRGPILSLQTLHLFLRAHPPLSPLSHSK